MKTSSAHFDSTINAAIFYKKRGICSQITHGFHLFENQFGFFLSPTTKYSTTLKHAL